MVSSLGLIDTGVERAINALRKLRNAFAHTAESASLADPVHSSRLAKVYELDHANTLWAPLGTVLADMPPTADGPWTIGPSPTRLHHVDHNPGGVSRSHRPAGAPGKAASFHGHVGRGAFRTGHTNPHTGMGK
jgi:hypothetical protein